MPHGQMIKTMEKQWKRTSTDHAKCREKDGAYSTTRRDDKDHVLCNGEECRMV